MSNKVRAEQIFKVDGYHVDLDEILFVSDNGHVAMSPGGHTVMSINKSYVKTLTEAWAEWKTFKLSALGVTV